MSTVEEEDNLVVGERANIVFGERASLVGERADLSVGEELESENAESKFVTSEPSREFSKPDSDMIQRIR